MLGAGNPVGSSNPAGTGTILNYIGNRCYAYGGTFPCTTGSLTKYFDFTTGSETVDVTIQVNAGLRILSSEVKQIFLQVKFDGQIVALLTTGNEADDAPFSVSSQFIIPAYTRVEVDITSDDNQADTFGTATITGRII
jgi:hypothetical protein